jgi:hypothetical protein
MAEIKPSMPFEPGSRVSAHFRLEHQSSIPEPDRLGPPLAEAFADDDGRAVLEGLKPLQAAWLRGVPLQGEGPAVIGAFAEAA